MLNALPVSATAPTLQILSAHFRPRPRVQGCIACDLAAIRVRAPEGGEGEAGYSDLCAALLTAFLKRGVRSEARHAAAPPRRTRARRQAMSSLAAEGEVRAPRAR